MSHSTKRAAVVVPTAFLVAVSGLVAAPAMAQDVIEPQAIVDGYDANTGNADTATIAPAASKTIRFVNDEANDGLTTSPKLLAGTYWLRVQHTNVATTQVTTTYQAVTIAAEVDYTDVVVNTSAGEAQDTFALQFNRMPNTVGALDSYDEVQKATQFAAGTATDDITLTVSGERLITTDGTSAKTLQEGQVVANTITYLNLGATRIYAAATAGQVIDASVDSTNNSINYVPDNGEAGVTAVRLYDVTNISGFAAMTERQQLDALAGQTPVNSYNVTVTAVPGAAAIVEAYDTANDGIVTAADNYTVNFSNLDAPTTGSSYVLTVLKDGVAIASTPVDPNPENVGVSAGASEFYSYTTGAITGTNLNAGSTMTYRLTNANGTSIDADVEILPAVAGLTAATEVPVMVGDTNAVTFTNTSAETNYVVVTTTQEEGRAAVTVVGDTPGAAANQTIVTTSVRDVTYSLYAVPANGAGTDIPAYADAVTDAEQLAWLQRYGVAQLGEPYLVEVGAVDARAFADVADFDGIATVNVTFENLNAIPGYVNDTRYHIVQRLTAADGTVTETILTDGDSTTNDGDLTYAWATQDDQQATFTLYHAPANPLAGYGNAEAQLLALKNAGIVKSVAGDNLVVTVQDEDIAAPAPEPEPEPGTEQFQFFQNNPEAFSLVPANTPINQIFVGDWDGDGVDTIAYRSGNSFYLASDNSADATFTQMDYGTASDIVYIGDWDGDSVDTVAVRRGNLFLLSNDFSGGAADVETAYGRATDEVIIGDWDGDGDDTPSVRRGNEFHLNNQTDGGPADTVTAFGRATDIVVIGDWDGDGDDTPGVRRGATFYMKNDFLGGNADREITFGTSTDKALVGAFIEGQAADTIGIYRPSTN